MQISFNCQTFILAVSFMLRYRPCPLVKGLKRSPLAAETESPYTCYNSNIISLNGLVLIIKTILGLFLCALLSLGLVGCVSVENISEETALAAADMDAQTRNLQKLAKVWGFAKYHHIAFLTGERCWDTELLALIPLVRFANEEDVNDILYDWFTGLGDPGWDGSKSMFVDVAIDDPMIAPFHISLASILLINEIMNEIDWLDLVRGQFGKFDFEYNSTGLSLIVRTSEKNWPDLRAMAEGLNMVYSMTIIDIGDFNFRQMADMSWVNEVYLGASLAQALSSFQEIPVIDRAYAPVSFNSFGGSLFPNQNSHRRMDFRDEGYRLLGLFRLWNAINYFFPYLDILDACWNKLLYEHIPQMLAGTDRLSYELTLAALASRLHDAHIVFVSEMGIWEMFDDKFGGAVAPLRLTEAEGHLVVTGRVLGDRCNYGRLLMPGDVILRVNDVDIDEIIGEMLQFVPFPNDERALFYLTRSHIILRQQSADVPMNIDVLRSGIELRLYENTFEFIFPTAPPMPQRSHELLGNNIGLINPARLPEEGIHRIMEYFANTDGLIVDLRQRPSIGSNLEYELARYLVEERKLFVIGSQPAQFAPGVFVDLFRGYSGGISGYFDSAYFYENPVVILMDEGSMSHTEFVIMSLRNGPNVTVMGSNSIGANGNVVRLPLPGEIMMTFTGRGVYTPEGGQTQRIGLSPDIYVHQTIAGIREGRDELLEAAIEFLLEQ